MFINNEMMVTIMDRELITWDIYEIGADSVPLNGVMLRGRIRKFCIENKRNVLVENTQDVENSVRFAIPSGEDPTSVKDYIIKILPEAKVVLVREDVLNPVLSKLKVNIEDRYKL
tara:strand:- start:566 stop:910 length:345 start_codon:yes stop_codon:yes gene_type:complete